MASPTVAGRALAAAMLLIVVFSGCLSAAVSDRGRDNARTVYRAGTGSKAHDKRRPRKKKRSRTRGHRQALRPFPKPQVEDEFEDAEKRQEWFMYRRTYPSGDLPVSARLKAWQSRPQKLGLTAQTKAWRRIGPQGTQSYFPNNWGITSGRINTVAVSPTDPNIVLIGAATGGVWRSTDGGETFAPATDDHVDLAVGSIAFAAGNSSIVYAGMGDKDQGYFGTGVLKSTDAGRTWTRVSNSSLPAPGTIAQILVDPTDANRVYAAQYTLRSGSSIYSSGFFVSSDGGVNWTKTIAGLPKDVVIHPTNPNILYLAMTRVDFVSPTTAGVWRSMDRGATWTRIYTSTYSTTDNIKVAVTPAAPDSLYVLVGGSSAARVEISADGGSTWTNKGSAFDTGQFWYNCYIFVNPVDPNKIYVGTRDLWISGDAGTTYSNATNNFNVSGGYNPTIARAHPDQHHLYISPSSPNSIYAANDGGLWKSTDGGGTFRSLNISLSLSMMVGLSMDPTDNNRSYAGTQDNGTQKRVSGENWREFATGDGGNLVVDPLNPTIIYPTYIRTSVYRYNNRGDTYAGQIGTATTFNSDRVAFYPPFVGNGVNSDLYFGTYRLYVSTNRGAAWTAPAGTTDLTKGGNDVLSTIAVSRSNTDVIYTGSSNGRAMVSTNGGTSWTDITTGLPNRFIESITVKNDDPLTAYLTVSGYGTGHVYRTVNGGSTWTNISGDLPDVPVNTLLIDRRDPSVLYVGTDIGIFRSVSGGGSWETFNAGMPPVIVTKLESSATGVMQAATYGRGVYELRRQNTAFDLDGDAKTDVGVFRPSVAEWWTIRSSDSNVFAAQFGSSLDLPVPADYTGDGKTDIAFFRPSTSTWYVLRSEDSSFYGFPFGSVDDTPVPADFDGDGKADPAVFRPSASNWYVLRSSDSGVTSLQFGAAGDRPVPADYDGDGKADVGIYRPNGATGGEWWIQRSTAGLFAASFGSAIDKTVEGDWTGDGKADCAFFRPSDNTWYVLRSEDQSFFGFPFGMSTDTPAPGDYDGDGRFDAAVFRPSNAAWYINKSTVGVTSMSFGIAGDQPLPGVYVR